LREVHVDDPFSGGEIVDKVVDDVLDWLAHVRVHQWHENMDKEGEKLRAWIRGEPRPTVRLKPADDLHPQRRVEQEVQRWSALWDPHEGAIPPRHVLRGLMHWVPHGGFAGGDAWLVSGQALQKRCRRTASSAPGLDGWQARQLMLLPEAFFDEFAYYVSCMITQGLPVPRAWQQVRVCLIPKEGTSDLRPISVASVCWRVASGVILDSLDDWLQSWAPPALVGGIRGRSAADLHASFDLDIHRIVEGVPFAGGKVDLSKAFDRGSPQLGMDVMTVLGLDHGVATWILSFYDGLTAFFVDHGVAAQHGLVRRHGLLQGCPLSMAALAAIMAVFVHFSEAQAPLVQWGLVCGRPNFLELWRRGNLPDPGGAACSHPL
jgi:hypothetical protein